MTHRQNISLPPLKHKWLDQFDFSDRPAEACLPDLSLPALDRETVGSPVRRRLVRGAAALAGACWLGQVGRDDVVYDLGCADGRIVIEAARRHGARGVGIDLNPVRIRAARENARRADVERRVRFRQADLFATDFSPATVVMLYLLFEVNLKLMPQLWRQLRVGSRVESHDFYMGAQWPPEQIVRIRDKTLYAWTITPELKQ